jgi:5-methylcytosine-specific restriction endonuclease McrA
MPRKKIPCARCGAYASPSKWTVEIFVCNACRRDVRRAICGSCGRSFIRNAFGNDQRFCSRACWLASPRPCSDGCGSPVLGSMSNTPRCDPCREVRREATKIRRVEQDRQWRKDHPEHDVAKHRRRRAFKLDLLSEPYTLAGIAERDGYMCQWPPCGLPVDMMLSGLETWGPTVDHVIPVSKGGPDTPGNVQLMHRRCNIRKSDHEPW